MKAVILSADDFGLSPEVNAAVLRAHRDGLLTSAGLMVSERASAEAASIARECPALDVGLHLVLCRGHSALAPDRAGVLADVSGRFSESPVLAGMRYFFDRRLRSALGDECRAQIERAMELVGRLSHVDGHLNIHVHPVVADLLIELCAEYGVGAIRLPREPVLTTLRLAHDAAARKFIEAAIFRALSRRTRRRMAERGIRSTDWLFGLHQTGNLSEPYLLGVIAALREGVTEIYFHPAADTGATPPPPAAQRELELLLAPAFGEALRRARVQRIGFADLAGGSARLSPKTAT